jgi:hypothetical protein
MDATMSRHPTAPHNTETQAAIHRRRWMRNAITLGITLVIWLAPASAVHALPADGNGNYTQILCADPSTGDGLGISGMPEGLTNPASIDTWQITTSEVDCGSGAMTASRGVPMAVGQGNTYGQGTWSALLYQAPANVTINGGTIYRAEKAEGANSGFMGIIQQGGEYNVLYSLPRNCCDQGDWFSGNVASRGTFSIPFASENLVELTISPDGGHWDVNATCDPNGNNNSSCTLTGGQWGYRIFGGAISLSAVNDPQASDITGPMTSETPLRGSESATFSATDEGPGLAYVKLLVDGSTVQSQTIDTNDGRCVPVPGHDAYTWAYQVPCKTSVGGRTYELNTALVPDGSHHIQVIIEDAAGNESIVVDRTVQTDNAPADGSAPTVLAPSQLFVGAALSTLPGAWSAPTGAGTIAYAYQWEDCDSQGNNCTAIAGAQSASYTPTPGDVGHTLRLLVSAADHDGSASAASAATSTVLSSQGSLGALPGPGTSGASAGLSTVGVGAPNGTVASETAQLRLGVKRAISRTFAHRAFRLTGRLLDGQGHPIGGATLDVLQQIAGSATLDVIRHAKTRPDGTFAVGVPAGPSRLIEVAYRAFSGDASYTVQAKIEESVRAGVQLEIAPRNTSATGTIVLSGRVLGPIPSQGVVVELLVHYRGRWEPFRDPRTDASGHFQVVYQFEGGVGRFPFRALVFGGQSEFPFVHGESRLVDVSTN